MGVPVPFWVLVLLGGGPQCFLGRWGVLVPLVGGSLCFLRGGLATFGCGGEWGCPIPFREDPPAPHHT